MRLPSPTSLAGVVEAMRAASGMVQPVKARMFRKASFIVRTLPAIAPLPSLGTPPSTWYRQIRDCSPASSISPRCV